MCAVARVRSCHSQSHAENDFNSEVLEADGVYYEHNLGLLITLSKICA